MNVFALACAVAHVHTHDDGVSFDSKLVTAVCATALVIVAAWWKGALYVGRKLDPAAPEETERGWYARRFKIDVWRRGDILIWRNVTVLPRRCVFCNEPAAWRMVRELRWTPPNLHAAHALGALGSIVALIGSRMLRARLGVCETHHRRESTTVLALFVPGITGAALVASLRIPCSLLGIPFVIVTLVVLWLRSRRFRVVNMENGHVALHGVDVKFLDSLPAELEPGDSGTEAVARDERARGAA